MIILDLILTLFVYLIFPVIYVAKKGKVERKIARKFALLNSIFGAVFFLILRVIIGTENSTSVSFAPSIFYYFIGKRILTDKFYVENKSEKNLDYINCLDDNVECNKTLDKNDDNQNPN